MRKSIEEITRRGRNGEGHSNQHATELNDQIVNDIDKVISPV